VFIAYAGHAVGGTLECGDECSEVRVFAPDRLPELAFPHDGHIMKIWSEGRGV
jgi:hypothetical protein